MTTTLNRRQLLLARLAAQGLVGSAADSPEEVLGSMFAMQGQDLPGALYSVGLRMRHGTLTEVTAALDKGSLVRSWPMRGTLHLILPEDLGLILPLTRERMVRSAAARHAQLDIVAADVEQCRELALEALDGPEGMKGTDLFEVFEAAGQRTGGQRGVHLLWLLCLNGWLVKGPMAGRHQLFVPYDRWIGPIPERDPQEALATVALRYFRSHGPATERDFAWWTGLPLTRIRTALAELRGRLAEVESDGGTYLMAPEVAGLVPRKLPGGRSVLALPGFDEFLLGYADRSAGLAPEHAQLTVPGNNGMFKATIVSAGQVVGTWRRPAKPGADVVPSPFAELTPAQRQGFVKAAANYLRFAGC